MKKCLLFLAIILLVSNLSASWAACPSPMPIRVVGGNDYLTIPDALLECGGGCTIRLQSCVVYQGVSIVDGVVLEGGWSCDWTDNSGDPSAIQYLDINVGGSVIIDNIALSSTSTCPAPTVPTLPDTGQTGDFAFTFGEDSDYTINPPSYTLNGDSTTSDNVTGLMWQTDIYDNIDWYQASGTADPTYNPGGAVDTCGTANTGGYNDWRLPAIKELHTIVDFGRYYPPYNGFYFQAEARGFWSSTEQVASGGTRSWFVSPLGEVYYTDKLILGNIRCVRGNPLPANSFTDNGDDTVTDSSTGLMWQKTEGRDMDLEQALDYCEVLNHAGYTNWRLPNIKELVSLNDYSLTFPIDKTFFPDADAMNYWSSTYNSDPLPLNESWGVNGMDGSGVTIVFGDNVRCVR